MKEAKATTEQSRSVIVQDTMICNYAQTRYKLASALSGQAGYELASDFMYAVKLLPKTYSEQAYTRFLDDWGTVSCIASLYIDMQ